MNQIIYNNFGTKLGKMIAGVTDKGLCLLEFEERKNLETNLKRLEKKYSAVLVKGQHTLLTKIEHELELYFEGKLKNFSLPLDIRGTEFQVKVWNQLLQIPYGQTKTYQQLAKDINSPSGFRAIANANGSNNIAIVLPCHRVIASNKKLQGYAGGLWRKEKLLTIEKNKDFLKIKTSKQILETW
jgi:AraC family transcriptional regulator of adaptative response/methylated-DNA-[protein]-cysteine methyltransferase